MCLWLPGFLEVNSILLFLISLFYQRSDTHFSQKFLLWQTFCGQNWANALASISFVPHFLPTATQPSLGCWCQPVAYLHDQQNPEGPTFCAQALLWSWNEIIEPVFTFIFALCWLWNAQGLHKTNERGGKIKWLYFDGQDDSSYASLSPFPPWGPHECTEEPE